MTDLMTSAPSPSPDGHPYDYSYVSGMPLRPAPRRVQPSPDWVALRERLLSKWRAIELVPRSSPYIERLADHYWEGDAVMDRVVQLQRRIGAPAFREMLDTALDRGIDAVADPPVELLDLFAQVDRIPDWFDRDLAERGRVVLANATVYGKVAGLILESLQTAVGLPVSSATGATGMFTHHAARRLLESDHYFWVVSQPGIFDRYATPFKTNVRVRLMHAQVRTGLRARWGDDHFEHHGSPISNTDMAAGSAGFGLSPLLYDVAAGVKHSVRDLEAALMYWNYIGYVFGVSEAIRPRNVSEAVELLDYQISAAGPLTPWADELCEALVGLVRRTLEGFGDGSVSHLARRGGLHVVGGLAHHVAGDPLARKFIGDEVRDSPLVPFWSRLVRIATAPALAVSQTFGRRPGREGRQRRKAAEGDPFFELRYRVAKAYAEQQGVRASTYEGHDRSKPSDLKVRPGRDAAVGDT